MQQGPDVYGSTYSRRAGGSTLHWLGVSLRMLPEDFALRSRHGVGVDWPFGYDTLEPWYREAERALGVAADVADQAHNGITFAAGLRLPDAAHPAELVGQAARRPASTGCASISAARRSR